MALLHRLRDETRPQHEALERDLSLAELTRSVGGLREYLKRFYGFYAPWERAAARSVAENPLATFVNDRRKVPLLASDLAVLGEPETTRIPQCADLPKLNSVPAVLGSMYVLEGSTLGGQLIAREVEQHLPLQNDRGYSFFRAYGPETGAKWRAFGEILNAVHPADHEAAIEAGRATFQCLHAWLCRPIVDLIGLSPNWYAAGG